MDNDKLVYLKEFCEKFEQKGAVIFFADDKKFDRASYGKGAEWDKIMQKVADKLFAYVGEQTAKNKLRREADKHAQV